MSLFSKYHNYLESGCKIEHLPNLIESLALSELSGEAGLLHLYYQNNGKRVDVKSEIEGFEGVPVVVNSLPPAYTGESIIWFDPVELMPYYYSKSLVCSYAMRPVYFWQYATFLRLLKFEFINKNTPRDVFNPTSDRYTHLDEMDFITNIYCDESFTYSKWFNKRRMSDDFASLESELGSSRFEKFYPKGLSFWCGYYTNAEELRLSLNFEKEKLLSSLTNIDLYESNGILKGVVLAYNELETAPENAISSTFYSDGLVNYGQYVNNDLGIRILNQAPRSFL